MRLVKVLLVMFGALALCVFIGGSCVMGGYNQAVALEEATKSGWAEVENQLQRRFELIPNLVETVKGVAGQEKDVYLGVAKAREAYAGANSVPEKAKAAGAVESALSRLLVLREAYPQLRSNESFMQLQHQIEGTENRLTVARKRYNDGVKALNVFTRKVTGRFYSWLAGVEGAEYFEVSEAAKATPKVDFSGGDGSDSG